mmetsp:Transcript_23674/g.77049  ORF Transcript_23674/g.77049 Transcript_23674/m.77049 type:complete len:201 (-) Transcript_23674:2723-3325(-)
MDPMLRPVLVVCRYFIGSRENKLCVQDDMISQECSCSPCSSCLSCIASSVGLNLFCSTSTSSLSSRSRFLFPCRSVKIAIKISFRCSSPRAPSWFHSVMSCSSPPKRQQLSLSVRSIERIASAFSSDTFCCRLSLVLAMKSPLHFLKHCSRRLADSCTKVPSRPLSFSSTSSQLEERVTSSMLSNNRSSSSPILSSMLSM